MATRKLTFQEVAEIMMDAVPLAEHHEFVARVDQAIAEAATPEVAALYRDARTGLLLHLQSRERRGIPDAGVPYEDSVVGQAVQAAVPSLRDDFSDIKYGPH